MAVLARNDGVSRVLEQDGWWEARTPEELLHPHTKHRKGAQLSAPKRVHEHRMFLDVGANIGYLSLMHAFAGYQVVAVEAMEQNRAALRTSLCLNPGLNHRVTLVATALGSDTQVAAGSHCVTYTIDRNRGNGITKCEPSLSCATVRKRYAMHGQRDQHKAIWSCEEVSLRTLDEVMRSSSWPEGVSHSVHTMKMDVEGSERNVLAGATKLFEPSNAGRPLHAIFEVALDDVARPGLGSSIERFTRELAARAGYNLIVTGWNASWTAAYNREHNPYALYDRTAFLTRRDIPRADLGSRS